MKSKQTLLAPAQPVESPSTEQTGYTAWSLPWKVENGGPHRPTISDTNGCEIAIGWEKHDMEFIVRAVNSHSALLEAAKPFVALLQDHHARMRDESPVFGINDVDITFGQLRALRAAIKQAEQD